ncbi:MAG: thioredoxin family protein [Candidatus Acidiferrales bacterium]
MRVLKILLPLTALALSCVVLSPALHAATGGAAAPVFPPLEHWRQAVLSGDANQLADLYSSAPLAQIATGDQKQVGAADDVNFWQSWKAKGLTAMKLEIVQQQSPTLDERQVFFQVALQFSSPGSPHELFIATAQYWLLRDAKWQIATAARGNPARLRQPLNTDNVIYPPDLNARAEIAFGLRSAASAHKRVLLVFGGNWCFDCHVLDEAFHSPEIAPTLDGSFVVVHVNIGRYDKNLDLAQQYNVPLTKGVPALAVLDAAGKLVFSQQGGEFQDARSMAPEDILAFLNKWKPAAPAN